VAQILRPSSDRLLGAWLPSGGGSPTELWPSLDETSPADADYIYTETDGDACEVGLSSGSAPSVYTGHIVRYRVQGDGATPLRVTLYDNSVSPALEIDSWVEQSPPPGTEPTEYYRELSVSAAGNIASYSALSLRFEAVGAGGGDATFDAVSGDAAWDSDDGTTGVCSITVGSNSDRAIFVCVNWIDGLAGNASVSGVSSSVNGAFTLVSSSTITRADGGDFGVAWFVLTNPTAGAHTITVTMSEATDAILCAAISFYNVNQSTPYAGVDTQDVSNTGTTYNHVITTAAGDQALSCMLNALGTAAAHDITTGTLRWELEETGFWGAWSDCGSNAASGSSTTVGYLMRNDIAIVSGLAVKHS